MEKKEKKRGLWQSVHDSYLVQYIYLATRRSRHQVTGAADCRLATFPMLSKSWAPGTVAVVSVLLLISALRSINRFYTTAPLPLDRSGRIYFRNSRHIFFHLLSFTRCWQMLTVHNGFAGVLGVRCWVSDVGCSMLALIFSRRNMFAFCRPQPCVLYCYSDPK